MQDTCTHADCQITTCTDTMSRRQCLAARGWVRALFRGRCDSCFKTVGQGSMFLPVPHLTMSDPTVPVLDLYFDYYGECCAEEVEHLAGSVSSGL
jgi:hypothetical protein